MHGPMNVKLTTVIQSSITKIVLFQLLLLHVCYVTKKGLIKTKKPTKEDLIMFLYCHA